jgi:rubredoxin
MFKCPDCGTPKIEVEMTYWVDANDQNPDPRRSDQSFSGKYYCPDCTQIFEKPTITDVTKEEIRHVLQD